MAVSHTFHQEELRKPADKIAQSVKAHLHVPEIKYKVISQKHLWKKGLLCYMFIFEKFFFKWSYNNVN